MSRGSARRERLGCFLFRADRDSRDAHVKGALRRGEDAACFLHQPPAAGRCRSTRLSPAIHANCPEAPVSSGSLCSQVVGGRLRS
jgi:hypothetical protein